MLEPRNHTEDTEGLAPRDHTEDTEGLKPPNHTEPTVSLEPRNHTENTEGRTLGRTWVCAYSASSAAAMCADVIE